MEGQQTGTTAGTTCVLVVDDCDVMRSAIKEWVQRAPGFECAGAYADAESAWAAMLRTTPDLVVMDIGLPGMNGITCTMQIKTRWPKVGVLMLTGIPDDQVLFEALAAGADGFLYKPILRPAVVQAIQQVKSGKSPLAEEARRRVLEHFRAAGPGPSGENLLTDREREIMAFVRLGRTDKEIAQAIGIALCTVHSHLHNIFRKLNTHNRQEAVFRLWGVNRR